jgi:hypothetical protein
MTERWYAWVATEGNGREAIIPVTDGQSLSPSVPMISQDPEVARSAQWRTLAHRHARQTGHDVRLVTLVRANDLDEPL